LIFYLVNIDGDTEDPAGTRCTFIRKCENIPWPMGFQEDCLDRKSKVFVQSNEKAVLISLIASIYRQDPDIIVGHNFIDFDLDVILQRMKYHKLDGWSKLGRLSRKNWPKLQAGAGGTSDSTYAERMICSGRLLCDTFRASKDFLNSKSNALSYLAEHQLNVKRDPIEYDKIESYFWDKSSLLKMIDHCEFDTYLVTELMFKLQVIPMTKQLTTLAGNLWTRTMVGARAERNEYLLLHEFHSKKYICPDRRVSFQVQDEETGEVVKKGKRKAAYAGGLVLEPKAGLYDKFVLLLDFNSLYPSIIQEYNICFTTVQRSYNGESDVMPELPDTNENADMGVLPKLLKGLVERRRAVKGLMKGNITSAEYAQYDIRQKALKLTANSMYGCLGFVHSRFFAKPIAMLITHQGREILQKTISMAESENLDVIYGDTDSIMINTNCVEIEMVKKIANDLKTKVNNCYKLLEIEMDGMFKKLLLLKKKKYAAQTITEVNGGFIDKLETKGLDLVRRDWCELSHQVSKHVLTQIFNSSSAEESVYQIHEYLKKVKTEVLEGRIDKKLFVIDKVGWV
jgi:DNA polymerase alpha subunit A